MSLINDALKRASQLKPPLPAPTTSEPPLRPVEHKRPARVLLFGLPALLAVVAGLAAWLFVKAWQAQRITNLVYKIPVAARELTGESAAAAKKPTSSTASEPAGTNLMASSPSAQTNNQSAAAEPPKPPTPALRLQGIFYRTTRPSAIISGKTVSVGDKVGNAKVVAIDRDSATVLCDGETKVLTLE